MIEIDEIYGDYDIDEETPLTELGEIGQSASKGDVDLSTMVMTNVDMEKINEVMNEIVQLQNETRAMYTNIAAGTNDVAFDGVASLSAVVDDLYNRVKSLQQNTNDSLVELSTVVNKLQYYMYSTYDNLSGYGILDRVKKVEEIINEIDIPKNRTQHNYSITGLTTSEVSLSDGKTTKKTSLPNKFYSVESSTNAAYEIIVIGTGDLTVVEGCAGSGYDVPVFVTRKYSASQSGTLTFWRSAVMSPNEKRIIAFGTSSTDAVFEVITIQHPINRITMAHITALPSDLSSAVPPTVVPVSSTYVNVITEVEPPPAGQILGAPTSSVISGSVINLKAVPAAHFEFKRWVDVTTKQTMSEQPNVSFKATTNPTKVKAVFGNAPMNEYKLSTDVNFYPNGKILVNGALAPTVHNQNMRSIVFKGYNPPVITLSAVPAPNYRFDKWTIHEVLSNGQTVNLGTSTANPFNMQSSRNHVVCGGFISKAPMWKLDYDTIVMGPNAKSSEISKKRLDWQKVMRNKGYKIKVVTRADDFKQLQQPPKTALECLVIRAKAGYSNSYGGWKCYYSAMQ